MEINDHLIDRLAHLSRLAFSSEERKEISGGLREMISFVDKLNELDTLGEEPLLHISENENILREDEPGAIFSVKEAMQNSRFPDAIFFNVPKVIIK